ncbi:MAG: hypothetical protein FJY91_02875 [Candidatus Harrisonbacteria bacterium]|nr:hypothetical protein [Candidatus Harrisonbacteria bacterium]
MRKQRWISIPLFILVGFFFAVEGLKEYGIKRIEIVSDFAKETDEITKGAKREKEEQAVEGKKEPATAKKTEEIIFPDLTTLAPVKVPEKMKAIYVTAEVALLP